MTPYYQDDSVTIYHGDCREVSVDADVIVTDPPYGVNYDGKNSKWTGHTAAGYDEYADTQDNLIASVLPFISERVISGARMVLTPGRASMFLYPEPRAVGAIFFPAGSGSGPWGFTCSQPIFYYGKDPYLAGGMGRRPDSFSHLAAGENDGHPCQKPLKVMHWLVNRASLVGETVLDPFMGSGTTLRAAKDLGRKAIGIEISERYCEIAARRMGQEVLDLSVTADRAVV